MSVFQVTAKLVQPLDQPAKRLSRRSRQWFAIQWRVLVGGFIIAMLAALLPKLGIQPLFFLLLPVFVTIINVSITNALSHRVKRNILLTTFLALLYFSAIMGFELLTHPRGTAEYIVVGTTLALAVMVEPLRNWAQTTLEQRFNLREDAAIKAVESFTSTLREEIDLGRVRDGLFSVVQQTLQPRSVAVWMREAAQSVEAISGRKASIGTKLFENSPLKVVVNDDDALVSYFQKHPEAIEMNRLQISSPLLDILKMNALAIVLPFVSQGELIALLTLGSLQDGKKYTREDRGLLNSLAAQVAPALRVGQLVQEQQAQVRERERIEQELRTAQEIQHTFLPKEVPTLPGWKLIPYYQSAREVGGDFYDFLPFADGRLGIVIGDVTDKGVPAALVMTATRTMLRTAAQEQASPAEVLARVNDLLFSDIPPGMFVTCFFALLDPGSGRLRYANAGHEPPFRHNTGSACELWATGMPLGMMPGTCYDEYESTVLPGESLLFYSDGLVEAHNLASEMFGFPRLKSLLQEYRSGVPLIDFLLGELQRFTGEGWEQEDDVTLVALQRSAIHETTDGSVLQEAEISG